ncbi:MAG: garA 1 [Acidobacteria bacterium]|nr:garA 1 [Acidobacteriota bacterium]
MRTRLGRFVFDTASRTLTRDGAAVALTPKAFALLESLVAAHPAAVAKEALYAKLWPDVVVEPGNVHNVVAEVRGAIGHDAIRTVHRFGYVLALDVGREAAASEFVVHTGTRELPLLAGENILGRDTIEGPDVSRRHARIVISGSAALLEDLGSKNGTWLRGARLHAPAPLDDGDEIHLGRTRIVFRRMQNATTLTVA